MFDTLKNCSITLAVQLFFYGLLVVFRHGMFHAIKAIDHSADTVGFAIGHLTGWGSSLCYSLVSMTYAILVVIPIICLVLVSGATIINGSILLLRKPLAWLGQRLRRFRSTVALNVV